MGNESRIERTRQLARPNPMQQTETACCQLPHWHLGRLVAAESHAGQPALLVSLLCRLTGKPVSRQADSPVMTRRVATRRDKKPLYVI